MKFGTFFAYWAHEWAGDYMAYARRIRSLGFDVIEISAGQLLALSDKQLVEMRALCRDIGLEVSSNIGPAKQYDVSSSDPAVRQAGIEYLSAIMRRMSILDSQVLIGILYSHWPYDFVDTDKPAVWSRAVQSVKALGNYAESQGIRLCLEVVNRFENFLLNTSEEAIRFLNDVEMRNVEVLLDTFHMNIEEDSIPDAIRLAEGRLGHLHVGEGNRKVPGKGHLPWKEIGKALKDISYDRFVIMEPFVLKGGQIGNDIKVWRDLSGGADQARLDADIKASLAFLKDAFLG